MTNLWMVVVNCLIGVVVNCLIGEELRARALETHLRRADIA